AAAATTTAIQPYHHSTKLRFADRAHARNLGADQLGSRIAIKCHRAYDQTSRSLALKLKPAWKEDRLEERPMYCPKCAAQIEETQKFCCSCGANVSLVSQALEGRLPNKVTVGMIGLQDLQNWHGRSKKGRHRDDKTVSIEKAAATFFTGIGFVMAALAVLRYFPGGFTWGWAFFIPGFACIGEGVGQYLRLKEQRQQQPQSNPQSSYQNHRRLLFQFVPQAHHKQKP